MPVSDSSRRAALALDSGRTRSGNDGDLAVAVVQRAGADPVALLDEALEASGFWRRLSSPRGAKPDAGADPVIAIKPDLDVVEPGAPTGTDPVLVEALIARLRERGYARVVLCDGRNRADHWLHNRDALGVPDLIGYSFEAPEGVAYDVAWADDAPHPVPLNRFDDGSALHVNGAWAEADFRISFGTAKTDDAWGYALCVQNLLGLVSSTGRASGWSAEDRCLHLLRRVPPDFAILDAVVSSHGSRGSETPRPLRTDTVVASASALLVDWVAALKMDVDPYVSPLNAQALDAPGLPDGWTLVGDTLPWDGWVNPAPTLIESTRARGRWPELDELVRAILRPTDRESFPFQDVLLDQVNATVLTNLDKVSEPRLREVVLGLLAWGLGWTARARQAFVYNAAKDRIVRSTAPLGLDLEALGADAFDDTVRVVEAFGRVLHGAPVDPRGFRIRTVGGHIHFAGSRILPLDFDAFVEQVEVGASIRYMNDYLGGSWTVIDRDDQGRPLRQAERNVYLPQPNWVGVFGGEEIDVQKVERIEYEPDRHTIWWRTVSSPNGSADSDDGSVIFARTPAGQVDVRIFARQRFLLPPPVASARVERWPGVHGELVSDAYGRFFDGTIANLRAAYDGQPFRIGRERSKHTGQVGDDVRSVMTGALALASRVLGWAPPDGSAAPASGRAGHHATAETPPSVDDLGFTHFAGRDAPVLVAAGEAWGAAAGDDSLTPLTFLAELGRAVGRDLAAASSWTRAGSDMPAASDEAGL